MPIITDLTVAEYRERGLPLPKELEGCTDDVSPLYLELRAAIPSSTVIVTDADLTLFYKDDGPMVHMDEINGKGDFHHVSLNEDQRKIIVDTANEISLFAVLTARGEFSTLVGLFGKHAAKKPGVSMCVASNCGHHVLLDTKHPDAERISIPLGNAHAEEVSLLTINNIGRILEGVGMAFDPDREINVPIGEEVLVKVNGHGEILLDLRELCGAIVFRGVNSNDLNKIQTEFQKLMTLLGPQADDIYYVSKNVREVDGHHDGYIDFKQRGMTKRTAEDLLGNHFQDRIFEDTKIIVAGDSKPDLEMMQALTEKYGADRVICIWVGDDLEAAREFVGEHDLTLRHLPGTQYEAIPKMYRMLDAIKIWPMSHEITAQAAAHASRLPFALNRDDQRTNLFYAGAPRPDISGTL